MKPFGDRRQNLTFVCTINLDEDVLSYSEESGHIQLPLARLQEPSPIQRSEFTPFEAAAPAQLDLTKFSPPYQKPSVSISKRWQIFSSRIILDFTVQWRYILRSLYSESTFRRLAKAVISIATCNFTVDEISTSQQIDFRSSYVTILDVPSWTPYSCNLLDIRGTVVVLHQDLQTALKITIDDAKDSNKAIDLSYCKNRTYLLLSIRHMLVCYANSTGDLFYTEPTTLMDGLTLPSSSAINLLFQALSPTRPLPYTPIHYLPLEIQDRILEFVSEGSVEAARLGCALGLGSTFSWMRAIDWPRRGGTVELFISPSHRNEFNAVESKIFFGDVFSGVSYR